MSKRKKRKRSAPRMSPEAMLRPRLDKLWAPESLLHKEDAAIQADLDVVARGVKAEALLQTLLRAYVAAPDDVRARLDAVLPGWLHQKSHLAVLQDVLARGTLGGNLRERALAWLDAAGADVTSMRADLDAAVQDMFYQAYDLDDGSQANVTVFFYAHPRKNRVRGLSFLIDYNPPWDGAVKDAFLTPRSPPRKLLRDFEEAWAGGWMEHDQVTAEEAKAKILSALRCNRTSEIRLPRDLIAQREPFVRYVLSLPDGPDTPPFTEADFDYLSRHGERPSKIVNIERTVGRRVRLEDGKEVWVLGGPDFDEDW